MFIQLASCDIIIGSQMLQPIYVAKLKPCKQHSPWKSVKHYQKKCQTVYCHIYLCLTSWAKLTNCC